MRKLRWGLMGTGRMAATIAAELVTMGGEGMELVAVASRSAEKAKAFAERHGIHRFWGSYGELARDRDVDVVYVATPHSLHAENMLACVRGGKAVLCEKPFTINAREAREVIDEARRQGVFVMEAMWTRFLPAVVALREWLARGEIGPVQMLIGGGAFIPERNTGHYLWNKALGGGALLDAGVYLVSMASMILGTPTRVHASGVIGSSGIDEQDAMVFEHAGGATAVLYVSLRTRRAPDLEILGESGRIGVAAPIFRPARLTLWPKDGEATTTDFPIDASGYGYQLREVARALATGRRESAVMPLAETLGIMQTMDAVRLRMALAYDSDKPLEA